MRYVKIVGLLVVVTAALMAFAGSASAGTFTYPKHIAYTEDVHAVAGEDTLHGSATITCKSSTIDGNVASHGNEVTGKISVKTLTFAECGTNDVTVLKGGTLEAHTHPGNENFETYAILTSTGAEVSVQITSLGVTCIYTTSNTQIGTVTESTHEIITEAKTVGAKIHLSAKIPRTGGSCFCGSSGEWTGQYEITTPFYLDYD